MTAEEVAQARALIDAAAPGTWEVLGPAPSYWITRVSLGLRRYVCGAFLAEEDARFVAAARKGWPAALDEVERLEGELRLAEAEAQRLRGLVEALAARVAEQSDLLSRRAEGA
jgi:hypothetical protein